MVKFSLRRLVVGGKYSKLTQEEGFDNLPNCGLIEDFIKEDNKIEDFIKEDNKIKNFIKEDNKMTKNNLLLNNQLSDKLSQNQPLKKISNKLANDEKYISKCKVINKDSIEAFDKGLVNIGFVDAKTESSSWFQPHMSRDSAIELIKNAPSGTFVVRNSSSHSSSGCLAITLKVPTSFNDSGVVHYLIVINHAGFRIKGFTKIFKSLSELVIHYSVMKENLPCRLIQNEDIVVSDRDNDFVDLELDPEFPELVIRLAKHLSNPFL